MDGPGPGSALVLAALELLPDHDTVSSDGGCFFFLRPHSISANSNPFLGCRGYPIVDPIVSLFNDWTIHTPTQIITRC
jgi:hypothetical protein